MNDPQNDPRQPQDSQPQEAPPQEPRGFDAAPGAIQGDSGDAPEAPPEAQAPAAPPPPAHYGTPGFAPPPAASRPAPPPPPPSQQGWQPTPTQQQPQQPRPVYGAAPQQPQQPQQQPPGYGGPPPQGNFGPPRQPPYGAPPPGWGGYPPPQAPRGRSRVIPVVIGLSIFVVVIIVSVVGLLSSAFGGGGSAHATGGSSLFSSFMGSQVGILQIEGVLGEGEGYGANTKALIQQVHTWTDNDHIKAMVVRVNSPGGAVSATQELVQALEYFRVGTEDKPGRPIVVSMGDVAASGGYYVAMPADKVFANDGSLTGSVGVIMSFYDYQGLQEKIGLDTRVIKSGEFKDMGSGSRPMTEAEKELLNTMIQDVYEQFLSAVVDGRTERVRELLNPTNPESVTREQVEAHLRQYCDGRIFSGRQALEYGMIDEIGTLDDAIDEAARLAGLPADQDTVTMVGPIKRQTGIFGLGEIADKLEGALPERLKHGGVTLEYRFGH